MHREKIDIATSLAAVHVTVADLNRSLSYYRNGIGLEHYRTVGETAYLGCGGKELLLLTEKRGAKMAGNVTGLYHFALLLPSRVELGKTVRHLLDTRVPISGSADHAVSEAIYLSDPDGHGIEIYRDRPRSEWTYEHGALKITTEPFDADGVLGQDLKSEGAWTGLHPDAVIGHIHLRVSDLDASESFYVNTLGFDLIARYGLSASFVSAGGYHHHIGMNTWGGRGAPPPPTDSLRMQYFALRLLDPQAISRVTQNLRAAGIPYKEEAEGTTFEDPSANLIMLVT